MDIVALMVALFTVPAAVVALVGYAVGAGCYGPNVVVKEFV